MWYTVLRDPFQRFVSHYQHQYMSGVAIFRVDVTEWMRTFERDNWMVRMIAGEEVVAAARQILAEKFRFVGFIERFDESLLLLRHRLNLPDLDVDYPSPSNASPKNGIRRQLQEHIHDVREEILERNELDLELYRFALEEIWPRQLAEYGPERMAVDLRDVFRRSQPGLAERCRVASFAAYRHLIYKPSVWLDRTIFSGAR